MARPLERICEDTGKPYERPPIIEVATDKALTQDLIVQSQRALIRDKRLPDYLPTECLVHLIREARRREDGRAHDAILPLLLARCEATLNVKVASSIPGAVQLREDILADFAELFAIDGSPQDKHALDFYEVRFNMAFASFRITRLRPELAFQDKHVPMLEPSEEIERIDQDEEKEAVAWLADLRSDDVDPENKTFRKQVYQAIIDLPPDQRKAVVLVYLLGYTQKTAAELCDVDERTIRNRLTRAFEALSKLKEDA